MDDIDERDGELGDEVELEDEDDCTIEWAMIDPRVGGGVIWVADHGGDLDDTYSWIHADVIGVDAEGGQHLVWRRNLGVKPKVGVWTRICGESSEPEGLWEFEDEFLPNERLLELAKLRASYPGFEDIVDHLEGYDRSYKRANEAIVFWIHHQTDDIEGDRREFIILVDSLQGTIEDWGEIDERFHEVQMRCMVDVARELMPEGLSEEGMKAFLADHLQQLARLAAPMVVDEVEGTLMEHVIAPKEDPFPALMVERGLQPYVEALATLAGIEVDGEGLWHYGGLVARIPYRG